MTEAAQARADRQALEDGLAEEASRVLARFLVAVQGEASRSLGSSGLVAASLQRGFGLSSVTAAWNRVSEETRELLGAAVPGAVYAKAREAIEKRGTKAQARSALARALAFEGATEWQALAARRARTSATRQFAERQLARFEAAGVTAKQWDADLDSATRPTHRAADGQLAALSEPFEVGGFAMQYPGDPEAPPEETENCRCVIIGVQVPASVIAAVYAGEFEHSPLWHPRGHDGKFIPHQPHKGDVADLIAKHGEEHAARSLENPPPAPTVHEQMAQTLAEGGKLPFTLEAADLKLGVEEWVTGKRRRTQSALDSLTATVNAAPPTKNPLWRGLSATKRQRSGYALVQKLSAAEPGDTIETDRLASWSATEEGSHAFASVAGLTEEAQRQANPVAGVILRAEPGIKALPLEGAGGVGQRMYGKREQESIAPPSSYEVVSNEPHPSIPNLRVVTVKEAS